MLLLLLEIIEIILLRSSSRRESDDCGGGAINAIFNPIGRRCCYLVNALSYYPMLHLKIIPLFIRLAYYNFTHVLPAYYTNLQLAIFIHIHIITLNSQIPSLLSNPAFNPGSRNLVISRTLPLRSYQYPDRQCLRYSRTNTQSRDWSRPSACVSTAAVIRL